jgi:hypothetical protein
MGSWETDKMIARDGITSMTDPIAFGKEWQVLETEPLLFHNAEGVQHPALRAIPEVEQSPRRLGASISRDQAEIACANVGAEDTEDCVFDVMATNDVDMVELYEDMFNVTMSQ